MPNSTRRKINAAIRGLCNYTLVGIDYPFGVTVGKATHYAHSIRYVCFARVLPVGMSPASLASRKRSGLHRISHRDHGPAAFPSVIQSRAEDIRPASAEHAVFVRA